MNVGFSTVSSVSARMCEAFARSDWTAPTESFDSSVVLPLRDPSQSRVAITEPPEIVIALVAKNYGDVGT